MTSSHVCMVSVVMMLALVHTLRADTSTVDVTINSVDAKRPTISITYSGMSRELELAKDVTVEIDGKSSDHRALLPGDKAKLTYDKERSVVTNIVVQRVGIAPAEKLAEGWDVIDERLIFLMVRLASVEASLEAVQQAIEADSRKKDLKTGSAKKAERANEELDRRGGGPVKWYLFYGKTAENFFYHPRDRNTTYHTETVLGGPR